MSSAPTTQIPLHITIAPFPGGFQGDMDETFQQACILMDAYIEGNFLTGLILPPGSTLPTTDQGPVAMGGVWYFFDPITGAYVPQTVSVKMAANYCKNAGYQIRQLDNASGTAFNNLPAAATKTYDMVISRMTQANVLSLAVDNGPTASGDTDNCPSAAKYTVGTTLLPSPAATDLMVHEHLVEGSDINAIQGEPLSLAFSVFCNQPGTYSAYLTSTGRDASYVFNFTITTPNVYTRIKIPNIPPMPASGTGLIGTWNFSEGATGMYLGVVMAVGAQYQTPTPNQWVSGFFAGTSSNTNLCTVTNNQMKIAAIKLEANASCTYCVIRSFEQDYHDAIRYYFTTFVYQSVTFGVAVTSTLYATNGALFSYVFPRRMCNIPTVVPYSWSTHTLGKIYNLATSADSTVATIAATAKGLASGGVTVTGAKGDTAACLITADARLA